MAENDRGRISAWRGIRASAGRGISAAISAAKGALAQAMKAKEAPGDGLHLNVATALDALRESQAPADFIRFAELFFHRAAPQDLEQFEPETLIALARAVWDAAETRGPDARVLKTLPAPGEKNAALLVSINKDMPFLYDSLMGEFAAQNASVRAAFHPIITVMRDAGGRRTGVAAGEEPGAVKESYIAVVFEETAPGARDEILKSTGEVLDEVKAAVADWHQMLARLQESTFELEQRRPASEDLKESIEFLRWLGENHFTFLGCRDYEFVRAGGEEELKPIAESGLGLLRNPDARVIRRADNRATITPQVREFLMQPSALIITKAAVRARVHRRTHMDYIGIKRVNAHGELVGERRFIGLFTSSAYHALPGEIPLLRRKVDHVMARSGYPRSSYAGKALANVLDSYPRDELFQTSPEQLYDFAIGILHISERPRTHVFLRFDKFDRFVSALLYMPRESFGTEAIERAADILANAFNGYVSAVYPQFSDAAVAHAHIIIGRHPGERPKVDEAKLQAEIARTTQNWRDGLTEALAHALPGTAPLRLVERYAEAFDGAYRATHSPEEAVEDISVIEALIGKAQGAFHVSVRGRAEGGLSLALFVAGQQAELSSTLPLLENFGLRVIEERSFRVLPREMAGERRSVMLYEFRMELSRAQPFDAARAKPLLEDAFRAAWKGAAENDGFNKLVSFAGLDWRAITVIRAIAKYLRQTGITFSQTYMEDALSRNAGIAALIAALFRARFDPELAEEARAQNCKALEERIEAALAEVKSLDDDRILRRFANAVTAMIRTNFFQEGRAALACKFEAAKLDELPAPRPLYEVFVYSPRVEGVHLRFGKVARGGIRWSDRREDFRTEVLSLVKAQQVKNAVIVPVGAKGGFYPKQIAPEASREEAQAEAVAAYKIYISALLDITDNIAEGKIVPPGGTVRYDGDDPYLVVAADKGTATFSDIANGLAQERGFWLGDAFASGGSKGYDHKKMGITARGAWEAVKRHFREMGRDTQTQPFTVIGIGDMSGDVFGNGMLLSQQIKLIAAFDHRDIFIDPDPDPEKSFAERRRLFALPRSSWADYDAKLISKGGGVFSKKSKAIALTPEIQAMTGLTAAKATPAELAKALLKAEADLLWFGGIGTFVKASSQSHAEVGDRTNDAVRVNGRELRAKVVGEGANLGCTQLGRVEFARSGGRINTDAIDNSAGVDTSDHEVNLKILLNGAASEGAITEAERDAILPALADDVAAHVLKDNYEQTLALSIAQASAANDLDDHMRLVRELERNGKLDRAVEYLPSDDEALALAQAGKGLTRPELAVLLAYAKLTLFDDIVASPLPDDPAFAPLLASYFPEAAARRFGAQIARHRLKREIVATVLVNRLVNAGGPAFVNRVREATGASAPQIVRAAMIASGAYGLDALRARINALDGQIVAQAQISMHQDVVALLVRETAWVLRNAGAEAGIAETVALYRKGIESLRGTFATLVSPVEAQTIEARIQELHGAGAPLDVAEDVAVLPVIGAVTDIASIAAAKSLPLDAVAGAFFEAAEAAGIDRLRAAATRIASSSHWERLALMRLSDELFSVQRALTAQALGFLPRGGAPLTRKEGVAAVGAWAKANAAALERAASLLAEVERSGPLTVAKLALAAGQLRDLAG